MLKRKNLKMKQEVRLTLPEFKKGQDKLSKNL